MAENKASLNLVSYFLNNNSTKHYQNRMIYMKVTAIQILSFFWNTANTFFGNQDAAIF